MKIEVGKKREQRLLQIKEEVKLLEKFQKIDLEEREKLAEKGNEVINNDSKKWDRNNFQSHFTLFISHSHSRIGFYENFIIFFHICLLAGEDGSKVPC